VRDGVIETNAEKISVHDIKVCLLTRYPFGQAKEILQDQELEDDEGVVGVLTHV